MPDDATRTWSWVADGAARAAVDAALVAAGWELDAPVACTTVVLDTPDGRLHRAGARLAHVTPRRGHAGARLLLDQPPSPGVAIAHAVVPSWPSDLPRGPVRERVAAAANDRILLPRAAFTSRRREGRLHDPAGAVVARCTVHDDVDVIADRPAVLVELAPRTGRAGAVAATADHLDALDGTRTSGDAVAWVLAALGIDPEGPGPGTFVPLDPAAPALDAVVTVCAALGAAIHANWQGTIDDLDPEFLHQLRVALRRTRSVLRMANDVVDDALRDRFGEQLRWLAGLTSRPRDLDVLVQRWDATVARYGASLVEPLAPVLAHLVDQRAEAHRVLADELQSPRAQQVLAEWCGWWSDPAQVASAAGPKASRPIGKVVAKRVREAHRRMVRDGSAITVDSPSDEVHQLRKDAKQLRYELECFGGIFPPNARERVIRRLAQLQDTLGDYQDADVLANELVESAESLARGGAPTRTIVALGEMRAGMLVTAAEVRERLAADIARFDAPSTRERLDALLDRVEELT